MADYQPEAAYNEDEGGVVKRREELGSCTKMIKNQGEIFALAHPHKKTGYKTPNSETNVRTLGSKTTYKEFYQDKVDLPTMPKSRKGLNYKPKLVPYDPNSIVNQLPVRFKNEPIHGARFCAPRNVSQFTIGSQREYERRFITTSKNFYVEHKGMPVGFTNQGILADKTRWEHYKQSL